MDKSLQVNMIKHFWKKNSKMNLQINYLRFRLANPDLQVRKYGFIRICDLPVKIFEDLFLTMVLKICEDLLDLLSNLLKIDWIHGPQLKTKIFKSGFVIRYTNQIRICGQQVNTSPWICKTNPRVHDSLIRFLQP